MSGPIKPPIGAPAPEGPVSGSPRVAMARRKRLRSPDHHGELAQASSRNSASASRARATAASNRSPYTSRISILCSTGRSTKAGCISVSRNWLISASSV